jgi:hypothetical protein
LQDIKCYAADIADAKSSPSFLLLSYQNLFPAHYGFIAAISSVHNAFLHGNLDEEVFIWFKSIK